jgi:RHS repeat-associated protein
MTWDAKNRLKTVTKNGTTWEWAYDYQDRRVREYQYPAGGTRPTAHKQFVWIGQDMVQERSGTSATAGTITRNHYTNGFTVGASVSTAAKYQTLTDHLGNVREVVALNTAAGSVGAVAARYDYSAYQGPQAVGPQTLSPTHLTIGRYYHHAGSGLELALYRAYDPELGRWLSEDPIQENGGINLYGYVGNEPIGGIDPLGLDIYLGGSRSGTGHFWVAVDIPSGGVRRFDFSAEGYNGNDSCGSLGSLLKTLNTKGKVELNDHPSIGQAAGSDEYYTFIQTKSSDDEVIKRMEDASKNPPSYGVLDRNCGDRACEVAGNPDLAGTTVCPAALLDFVKEVHAITKQPK